jgi:hypothetical protein
MGSEHAHADELDEHFRDIVRHVHAIEAHPPAELASRLASSEVREDLQRAIEALAVLPRMDTRRHAVELETLLAAHRTSSGTSAPGVVAGHLAAPAKHATVRKVSVSMPEDLTAAVQSRVGPGKFSQYVTEAVARQLELDLLADLSDLLASEHGPVPEEYLAEARGAWPDEH